MRRRNLTESELRRRKRLSSNEPSLPSNLDKNTSQFKDTNIRIQNNRDNIQVTIPKAFISKLNVYDLANTLGMLTSPLFLQKDETLRSKGYKAKKLVFGDKLPHIAVFMNNVRHYSGGRYYAVMFCKLLAQLGCRVTMVTDMPPNFISDFTSIDDEKRLQIRDDVDDSIWGARDQTNEYDLIIGVPNMGGIKGFHYAKKWKLPIYMMIFETPNYVSEYRGGLDSGEGYWTEYKRCLGECEKIICLAPTPMEKAIEWLSEFKVPRHRFTYLYPAINSYASDSVADCKENNEITFIGRHTGFKNPIHIIQAVSRMACDKPSINFIGSHSEDTRIKMLNCARKYSVEIRFFAGINDVEKYRIIKRSKVICIPTIFEGFGMPPAEAMYCGKPVVVYELPVLRGVYGDNIEYAAISDIGNLATKIEKLLGNESYRHERGISGQKFINTICHPAVMKENIRKKILGQDFLDISVGMICLNSADTIQYSLKSIYSSVKEILIVEGAVKGYKKANPEMVNKDGGSTDSTIDIIRNFPDPLGKIKVISSNKIYAHKMEMQNLIAEQVTGDIYLKVDSDEVYKESDIERIRSEFILDPELWIFRYKFFHFWHSLDQYAVEGQWESRMTRCWRWDKSFRHSTGQSTGFNMYFDSNDDKVDRPKYKVKEIDDRLVYHLNYAMQDPEKIKAKINYYKKRGIESGVKDTWSDWKKGDPTSPTHKGGTVKKFKGQLPLVLIPAKMDAVKEVKQRFDKNTTMMASPSKVKEKFSDEPMWTIGMIVLNEEKFLRANVESLLKWKNLARIVIVEGADNNYPKRNVSKKGLSLDSTGEIMSDLVKSSDKIYHVKYGFANSKQELRNQYLDKDHLIGSHLLVVDADEFYTLDDLNKLQEEVKNSKSDIIQWEFKRDNFSKGVYGNIVHFWHTLEHRVFGGYYSIPHQRVYKIMDGMVYSDSHNHPEVPTIQGMMRYDAMRQRWGKTSITCYHAGFLKDKMDMRDKQDYYYNRGEKIDRKMYSSTRELWFNWDGKSMEFPDDKMRIIPHQGDIPEALARCLV